MSRFTAHLGLTLYETAEGDPILRGERCQWQLSGPLTYDVGAEGSGETLTVPVGFITDLASIPQLVTNAFPPDGPWAKAAVIHDALYASCGTMVFSGRTWRTRARPYTRAEADGVLREAMGVLKVPAWKRFVIWSAVRLGGARGWGH